ncbi:MAG: SDR family NAD(P)-dependent oxidoreductase [Candidatus Hodarchaeota archaeon]
MQRLLNKVALITGGASGIGHGIALKFAQEGADIIISDIFLRSPDEVEKTKSELQSEIKSFGRDALILKVNVTKSEQVQEMVKKSVKKFNKIDILVNNAGIMPPTALRRIIQLKEEDWKHILDVNLNGVFLCSKFVAKQMIKQRDKSNPKNIRGRIISMSSVEGREGQPLMGPYCVSKFGVIALTQTLAKELASKNILANAICPGLVKTPLTGPLADIFFDEKSVSDQFNLKPIIERFAVPEDIANLALFLASDESSYITGQAINVCGGMQFY